MSEKVSKDVYAIAARVKNLARGSDVILSPVGEMLCNYYIHVMKAFYEFAKTLPDPHKEKLEELIQSNEDMPAKLIQAVPKPSKK